MALLLRSTADKKELSDGIKEILYNIDKYVIFVKSEDNYVMLADQLKTGIDANLPKAILLLSWGDNANTITKRIYDNLKKKITKYSFEIQLEDSTKRFCIFIIKNPDETNLFG